MHTQLNALLGRNLQAESELSVADFGVLVALTDVNDAKIRYTELAEVLQWEKSRLSHHITRMTKRGLVTREGCPDDARGAFVVLTDAGRRAIEQAAPGHVRTVREVFFDHLTDEQVATLAEISEQVLPHLNAGRKTS